MVARKNLIPLKIYITSEHESEVFFQGYLHWLKEYYGARRDRLRLLISFEFCKPTIMPEWMNHLIDLHEHFPKMTIVCVEGVDWQGNDDVLRARGVRILEDDWDGW